MEEHFEIKKALRVYDKVVSNGEKKQDRYEYKGLTASSSVDGYTVQITDGAVTLSIYFHNKYEFDYDNSKQLETFINKLEALADS